MRNFKKIISALILIAALTITYFQQKDGASTTVTSEDVKVGLKDFNYLPTSTTGQVIKHRFYNLSYNEKHEQAEWVAYSLSKSDIVYTNHKRPYFIYDPKVKTKSANYRNYKRSGYDRGHLCPAGDRRFSKEAHDETFYTSNVSPQKHNFNARIWNKLEQKTRYWAKKYNHLYVITGGVLQNDLKSIGKEKVSVPNQFYKVLLDYTQPEIKAIAFLLPHKDSTKPLYEFVVSIDELEKQTGIDFFPNLPDPIENKLEASTNYKNWSFR
ncbi:DNA/RNA non-specific endonuclease [Tenacibaculum sp.]|nr:DNA/RNA non-specific endonuclease [Tenacibaculum sp.]